MIRPMSWLVALVAFICASLWCVLAFPQAIIGSGFYGDLKPPSGGGTTTFDPSHLGPDLTLSGGNLIVTRSGNTTGNYSYARSIPSHSSGAQYAELTISDDLSGGGLAAVGVGNASASANSYLGIDNNSIGCWDNNSCLINNSTVFSAGSFTTGDVVAIWLNSTSQLFAISINGGNWNGNVSCPHNSTAPTACAQSIAAITGPYFLQINEHIATGLQITADYGGTPYAYTVPTGAGNW